MVSALSNWWSSALRKALDRFDKGAQEMRPSFCQSAKFNSSKDQTNVGTGLLKETTHNLSCSQHPGLFTSFLSNAGSVVFLDEGVCPAIWQREIIRNPCKRLQVLIATKNNKENAIGTSSLCVWCLLPCHWRCLQTLRDSSGGHLFISFQNFHILDMFTIVYTCISQAWIAEILE